MIKNAILLSRSTISRTLLFSKWATSLLTILLGSSDRPTSMGRLSLDCRDETSDGLEGEMKEIKLFNESLMPVIANNYV